MKNLKFLLAFIAVLSFMFVGCDSSPGGSIDYSGIEPPAATAIKLVGVKITGLANYKTKAGFYSASDEVCMKNGDIIIMKGLGIDGWVGNWNAADSANAVFDVKNGKVEGAFFVPIEHVLADFEGLSFTTAALNNPDKNEVIWDIFPEFIANRVRTNDTGTEFLFPAKHGNFGKVGEAANKWPVDGLENVVIDKSSFTGGKKYVIVGDVTAAGSGDVVVEYWRVSANGAKQTPANATQDWWDGIKNNINFDNSADYKMSENVSQYKYNWTWKVEAVD